MSSVISFVISLYLILQRRKNFFQKFYTVHLSKAWMTRLNCRQRWTQGSSDRRVELYCSRSVQVQICSFRVTIFVCWAYVHKNVQIVESEFIHSFDYRNANAFHNKPVQTWNTSTYTCLHGRSFYSLSLSLSLSTVAGTGLRDHGPNRILTSASRNVLDA